MTDALVNVMDLLTAWPSSELFASYALDEELGGSSLRSTKGACSSKPARTFRRGRERLRDDRLDERLQHQQSRRRRWSILPVTATQLPLIAFLIALLASPISAAFVKFENCLDKSVIESKPPKLQFIPLHFYANFNNSDHTHILNLTVYGNVSGSANQVQLPPPNDPQWANTSETLGKIVSVDPAWGTNVATTLLTRVNMLSFTPYSGLTFFCDQLVSGGCPIGPVWNNNSSDLTDLPSFSVAHSFYSAYAFATFQTTFRITAGDTPPTVLGCVSASITPDLGKTIGNTLAFVPLVILVLVGIATVYAGIYSPWGSEDIFSWTTNFGREDDLLRLVTPGFGDCLQYIQFVVLTGSLSLNYPGYYQPVVSKASWSTLMFNKSFISHGNGSRSIADGIYVQSAAYGLEELSQLVGITATKDIWAGMMIWLLSIVALVVIFVQAGFALRWLFRHLSKIQEEDLRRKTMPFTVGNVFRIVYNYFGLPAITLSMFQFVVAGKSPAYTTGLAALFLIILIGFSIWLFILVTSTRPRDHLFDDLPTMLLFGTFYNTYADGAPSFCLIPLLLTFVRGIAIGAVQPSGIAQIVLLAICEVVLILTLHAFRPFQPATSMNAYHTFFALVRLFATLLSVAFVPSLDVSEGPRGWIGYAILLMHGIVLVFGFFLNALQTIAEVAARLLVDGSGDGTGARAGIVKVFGLRQLSKRVDRRFESSRNVTVPETEALGVSEDQKSDQLNERPRSLSGSSAVLLAKRGSDGQTSAGFDTSGGMGQPGHRHAGSVGSAYTPTTPEAGTFSFPPGGTAARSNSLGVSPEPEVLFYRPPRARRGTLPNLGGLSTGGAMGMDNPPGGRSRASWWSQGSGGLEESFGPSASGSGTPNAAYPDYQRYQSDLSGTSYRQSATDYTTREGDSYYHGHDHAPSNLPPRRFGTGPADPTGPVASATGWFKGLFGGKTKDKGKGFEVFRGSRAPPQMTPKAQPIVSDEHGTGHPSIVQSGDFSDGEGVRSGDEEADAGARRADEDDDSSSEYSDIDVGRRSVVAELPPSLPSIDTGGAIELPTRIASRSSSKKSSGGQRPPRVPRKSSKRKSAGLLINEEEADRLRSMQQSPSSPEAPHHRLYDPHRPSPHLHPSTASSSRLPFGSEPSSAGDKRSSVDGDSTTSSIIPPADLSSIDGSGYTGQGRYNSSALTATAPGDQGRPTSMGYVQKFRTSDQIHIVEPGSPLVVDYRGSAAELVGGSRKSAASSERRPSMI
ncbi:hypothetical protein FGG08_002114 [Glutinoglossum americanum]|uniref:ML-like domain-containing protein n=1 Tax=Glutinoglossum americanum TaxID=1670608 RepID=A0A9P8L4Q6_9PEZI|nr:hypothetical protein FGG08_002114 [Glutinoglossum americanum]